MKYFLSLILSFLLIPSIACASVRISEVAWMGVEGENGQFGEWIELYNDTAESVNLAGWKLFVDGGNTLLFPLTKSIPAGGYLLVERVTPSMSDPVPGINDEAGSFGGGGLSNSGEFLVLKDGSGATVSSIDAASGWPAGDATTKQTMQESGGAWVTGTATPDAPYGGIHQQGGGDSSGDTSGADVVARSSSSKPKVSFEPKLTVTVPSQLYQYVVYTFTADAILEDGAHHNASGFFEWNFGDGTATAQKGEASVTHQYRYPGVYTLWVGYRRDPAYDPDLVVTKTIKVGSPTLALSVVGGGTALEVTNQSGAAVDLSSWHIVSNGYYAALPAHTLLAPDATVTFEAAPLGFERFGEVALARPGGEPLSAPTATPRILAASTRTPLPSASRSLLSSADLTAAAADVSVIQEAPARSQTNNRTKTIVIGAVAFAVLALLILLERIMAKREYS